MKKLLALVLLAFPALAHPMGNFSVNRWSALTAARGELTLVHVVDLAEIPTQITLGEAGFTAPPAGEALARFRAAYAARVAKGLVLLVDGAPAPVAPSEVELSFPEGAAGLPTLRLKLAAHAALGEGVHDVVFRDEGFPGRIGWREVIARADEGAVLASSDVPEADRSRGLTEYPVDPAAAPAETSTAHLSIRIAPAAIPRAPEAPAPPATHAAKRTSPVAAAPAAPAPSIAPVPRHATPTRATPAAATSPRRADRLGRLMTLPRLTPRLVALALLVAFGLGALHALSPGHGKTLVAAYLVGSRGTPLHALLLGLVVTASHTAGVFALGLVTLSLSKTILPERLLPILEAGSGAAIVLVALSMLRARLKAARRGVAHDHDHGPGGHTHDVEIPEGAPTAAALLSMGISGGIVPCPSALVVLLSAIALHRVAFGLVLIVAFSLGLAAVLTGIGFLVVRASRLLSRSTALAPWAARVPVLSAALVALLGVAISTKGLADAGVFRLPF